MLSVLLPLLLKASVPVAVALLGWVGHALGQWLKSHARSQTSQNALQVLDRLGMTVIRQFEQQAALILAQGSMPIAEAGFPTSTLGAKDLFVRNMKALYGPSGLRALAKALQMHEPEIDALLGATFHACVTHLNNQMIVERSALHQLCAMDFKLAAPAAQTPTAQDPTPQEGLQ